jgi:hypothetical protein
MKTLNKFKLLLLVIIVVSCNKDDETIPTIVSKSTSSYSGKQAVNYFDLLCTISKSTPGFFPPQVARAYGYVGIAGYEAVYNGIPEAISLGNQLNGLKLEVLPKADKSKTYNWGIAYNTATAEIIRKMFDQVISKQHMSLVDQLEKQNNLELNGNDNAEVIARSVKFGKDIASAIYTYSKNDGADLSYLDPFQLPYVMPNTPSDWVPTSAVLSPISPKWGTNRPFLVDNVSKTQPSKPVAFSTDNNSEFHKQAMLVYNQVTQNTEEETEIAKYWADDPFNTCTPTGHAFNILTQLLQETRATLEKSVVALAKISIAENDAFISCWKGKYNYNLIRPVSYIRKYIDASFTTVIGTPPFPAYTSGHSCEMGAASRIFINMFASGSGEYQFTDYSQLKYGFSSRSYSNFNSMAEECAKSRYYGGIHYPMDNDKGLQVGRAIGDNVNTHILWPSDTN